jgi:hypothetical protein
MATQKMLSRAGLSYKTLDGMEPSGRIRLMIPTNDGGATVWLVFNRDGSLWNVWAESLEDRHEIDRLRMVMKGMEYRIENGAPSPDDPAALRARLEAHHE